MVPAGQWAHPPRVSGTPGKAITDPPVLTLGDLLYADPTRHRVAEEDWQALVQAVASGSRPALHVLFERTHRIVFTLLARLTGNRQAAESLTVDVFHDVWRRAADYRPGAGTVVGWIMNQARARGLGQQAGNGHAHATDPAPLRLRAALGELEPAERQVIEEAFFSERTCTEIAARLNLTENAVRKHIGNGLARLQRALGNGEPEQ